jgi:hypothetical protein
MKKKEINNPVSAGVENILIDYNICAAACHVRKLNGVDYCEFICLCKELFDYI